MPSKVSYFMYAAISVAMCFLFAWSGVVQAEQPYQVEWIEQIGTTTQDQSHSVAVDGDGNVYISGFTRDSLGGPNAGSADAFLTKFNPSGSELWSQQIGSMGGDFGYSMAVDGEGNVYISGDTRGSFGGPNAGGEDAFLTKFDPSGAELWAQQIGTSDTDISHSVAVDGEGNVYISGYSEGSLGGPNAGGEDAFLTKFSPSGAELWSQQIGTSTHDRSWSVAVDGVGNAYISGETYGSLGGPNAGDQDAFLTKFDPSGTELWSQQIGTTDREISYSVAVDGAGNAYISGRTDGSFGGPNAGSADAFLTKFDPSGAELWSQQIGTTTHDYTRSVTVDVAGNAYISGNTDGSLGGPHAGSTDAFLTKFDPSGAELWSQQIGTTASDGSYSVAVDGAGTVYISGYTSGSLGGSNAGDRDAFLAKFTIPEPMTLTLFSLSGLTLLRRRSSA